MWPARVSVSSSRLMPLGSGSSVTVTSRPASETPATKAGAFGAGCVSMVALVHDLDWSARFPNMLRVLKVSSPMSVGSWLLSAYVAAASTLTGRVPRLGAAATAGAELLGPAVAAYTGALISDTAVPAWHDGYHEMPFVFAGSAVTAAAGLGLLAAPPDQNAPARNLGLFGACLELTASHQMMSRIGIVAEPYHQGRGGAYVKAGEALTILGAIGSLAARRSRIAGALSGAALLAASAATRWGIFHAGLASAGDPKYTVVPQRDRLRYRDRPSAEPS
jgi:hypothetical protein